MHIFMQSGKGLIVALACVGLSACNASGSSVPDSSIPDSAAANDGKPFTQTDVATFNEPWAMAFWPGTNSVAIAEKSGAIKIMDTNNGKIINVTGAPNVDYGGQGGQGDIVFAPNTTAGYAYATVYMSGVEAGENDTRGAVVARARLTCTAQLCQMSNITPIWKQNPKVTGRGHFSHRLAFSPDGKYLFITSGERQKMQPAQDPASDLGKVIRLDLATDKAEHWSLGHRNLLGLAFDASGNLWNTEMGPQGGDELNLVLKDKNYGWPKVSNGSHYGGEAIPDHAAGDGFEAPKVWWNPSISPSSLMIYSGDMFPQWKGDAFIGALSGEALIRVDLDGTNAAKADQWPMNTRIREVEQGPDGAIWLLEDGKDGRLIKLTPSQ